MAKVELVLPAYERHPPELVDPHSLGQLQLDGLRAVVVPQEGDGLVLVLALAAVGVGGEGNGDGRREVDL